MDPRIKQAAHNNAVWCDTICGAHGVPGEFHDSLWLNRHPVPRYYPNVVTLSTPHDSAAQLASIQALVAARLPGNWGVKDSFHSLDLATLGFQPAFEATWLWRAPSNPPLHRPSSNLRWTRVQSAPELAQWESTWNGGAAQNPSITQPRVFLPTLLANPDIVFIAGYQDQSLIAGAIANRTDDVVGLSNVFVPAGDPLLFWPGFVATAQEHYSNLPIVGYERAPELAIAQTIGFESLGPLRVWIRRA